MFKQAGIGISLRRVSRAGNILLALAAAFPLIEAAKAQSFTNISLDSSAHREVRLSFRAFGPSGPAVRAEGPFLPRANALQSAFAPVAQPGAAPNSATAGGFASAGIAALAFSQFIAWGAPEPLPANSSDFTSSAIVAHLAPGETSHRPAEAPGRNITPGIFGSTALPIASLPQTSRWRQLLAERADRHFSGPCNDTSGLCRNALFRSLLETVNNARKLTPLQQIERVNRTVNRLVRYRTDFEHYGVADYWSNFGETVMAGAGDCEDIAIVKMWMLRALGFSEGDLELVIVRHTRLGVDHAVLAIAVDGEKRIADNLSDAVRPESELRHYRPVFSFAGAGGSWLHGFKRQDGERIRVALLRGMLD